MLITQSAIEAMVTNPRLKTEFPFIRFAGVALKGLNKRCCDKKDTTRTAIGYMVETVKASLVSLPKERMDVFKGIIGADKIVIALKTKGEPKLVTR